MRHSVLTGLLATVVAACFAVPSWAANFQIDVMPAAAFDPITFAPIPLQFDSNGGLLGGRQMVIQVDVSVLSSGYNTANDERGFGNMSFSLDLFGAFRNTSQPGWQAQNSLVNPFDTNSAAKAPQWFLNADAGVANDLRSILISNPVVASPTASDPRPWQTMGTAQKVGSVFLDWDGIGSGGITVTPGQASFARLSNGHMELFQPGQATMAGNFLGSPGWQPPPPAAPTVAPPPQTPLAVSPPPAAPSTPVLPPAASPPQIEPVSPSAPQPPKTNPIAAPPISPPPIDVSPPAPIVPPAHVEPAPPIETGLPLVDSVVSPPINPTFDDVAPSIRLEPTFVLPEIGLPGDLSGVSKIIFPRPNPPIDVLAWHGEIGEVMTHELYRKPAEDFLQILRVEAAQSQLLAFHTSDFVNAYAASIVGNVDRVPEPSSLILAGLAAIALGVASHRRRRTSSAAQRHIPSPSLPSNSV